MTTNSLGHVFVVHGDLTKLACDAVIVPTDRNGVVEPYWGRFAATDVPAFDPVTPRVSRPRRVAHQVVRFVDVGATEATADLDWLRDGLRQGLTALAADVSQESWRPRHGRARPLLAMPVVGVGKGGFGSVRGEALRTVLDEALRTAASGPDIAIACLGRADYAALQSRRVTGDWPDLAEEQVTAADALGEAVREGSVAMFLGAGVSKAAGLPDWTELLADVASRAGVDLPEVRDDLTVDDLPRFASILRQRLGKPEFEGRLRQSLASDGYAVAHALVASMRIEEVVTTNFDDLYERACDTTFQPKGLCVLPWNRMPRRRPWLLKLHGDLRAGDLVFTSEDYKRFGEEHGVLGAVVQSLLVTRNLVFVGYSMRDVDFLDLARGVAGAFQRSGAEDRRIGTVLSLGPPESDSPIHTIGQVQVVIVGDGDPIVSASDARRLEIFLDRIAWSAARTESSWVLDPAYRALLSEDDGPLVDALLALPPIDSERWQRLRDLLEEYGAVAVARAPLSATTGHAATSPAVSRFSHDEAGYTRWLNEHAGGYVLNCDHIPEERYLVLHRASCATISGAPARGRRWTETYAKVCADAVALLNAWAEDRTGALPSRCGRCHP